MKKIVTAIAAGLCLSQCAPEQASQQRAVCPSPETAEAEVEQTIRDFFDALRGEGELAFKDVTTADMYSFDVGQRFEGRELADLIIESLAEGVEINWSLGPMDTTVACDVAWSQWENTGSVGIPPDVSPVNWLESAVIVHEDGRWKVDFFHSQRAQTKAAE